LNDPSDEKLMLAYLKGDLRAFELLVERHRRPVFHFVLRFLGDREQAEDLVQETFFRVARNAEVFRRHSKFKTWLYTIARNLCIDQHRKSRHRQAMSLDAAAPGQAQGEGQALGESLPNPGPGTDRSAAAASLGPLLNEAIESLPAEQREVFLLREYSGIPFKEIGQLTSTPPNTVKSRMRYALEGLRNYLVARGVNTADAFFDDPDRRDDADSASSKDIAVGDKGEVRS